MLPFSIELKPRLPVAEQILFAVKKAVVDRPLRRMELTFQGDETAVP